MENPGMADPTPKHNSETAMTAGENGSGGSRVRVGIICGLLLLASAINYLDRQTLASASSRIKAEFGLLNEQYGDIEAAFGYGFVLGSIVFGILADLVPVRWLYPVVLVSWSAATAATAGADDYQDLLWLRLTLGIFEAGHWPCGIRVVRDLTRSSGRTMGNGLLQSGTSIGAIMAPLVMLALLTDEPGSWRRAFLIVGAVGLAWVVAWFATVRRGDLTLPRDRRRHPAPWSIFYQSRMILVLVVVCLINTAWQLFRAWLHLFLEEGRGYTEQQTLLFNSTWFVATDVGCLGVGAAVLWLCARGLTATRARQIMFTVCALACLSLVLLPWLPNGPLLLAILLLGGAGALGVFPLYHAFTQDISGQHQGKITGLAGVTAWFLVPPAQKFFGRLVDITGSYDAGLAAAALLPAAACLILWLFWGTEEDEPTESSA
jgi:ACS family hexuronate transporter-like MFS transporter